MGSSAHDVLTKKNSIQFCRLNAIYLSIRKDITNLVIFFM